MGINHQTAGVAARECFAFGPHRLESALARLGCGDDPEWDDIQEMVILSTCNRVEIYAVAARPSFEKLEAFLSQVHGLAVEDYTGWLYRLTGAESVTHLLRVAAGLDSMVIGEPQILGQVTQAYSAARRHGTTGKILSRLFQTAIHAGKRAHTETSISCNPASISSVAVNLVAKVHPAIETSQILVLGAGEMAELAVEALRKRGASQIVVVNRTLARARELAQRWDGRASSLESLPELLPWADIVIASTGAPHTILSRPLIEQAMQRRSNRPLAIMDIAVPRDVEQEVAQVPGVALFNLDTLSDRLEDALARRSAEVPAVEAILEQEYDHFMDYLRSLDVVPIIAGIRKQANAIREAELKKTLRSLPELPPEAQAHLDLL
ncbi:MAG: glutamyl-tRNA reductase, partial [Anaerolineales bacterium]